MKPWGWGWYLNTPMGQFSANNQNLSFWRPLEAVNVWDKCEEDEDVVTHHFLSFLSYVDLSHVQCQWALIFMHQTIYKHIFLPKPHEQELFSIFLWNDLKAWKLAKTHVNMLRSNNYPLWSPHRFQLTSQKFPKQWTIFPIINMACTSPHNFFITFPPPHCSVRSTTIKWVLYQTENINHWIVKLNG